MESLPAADSSPPGPPALARLREKAWQSTNCHCHQGHLSCKTYCNCKSKEKCLDLFATRCDNDKDESEDESEDVHSKRGGRVNC